MNTCSAQRAHKKRNHDAHYLQRQSWSKIRRFEECSLKAEVKSRKTFVKRTTVSILIFFFGCAGAEAFVGSYHDQGWPEGNRLTLNADHTFTYVWWMDIDLSQTNYLGRWWSDGDTVFLQSTPRPKYDHFTVNEDYDSEQRGLRFEAFDLDSNWAVGIEVIVENPRSRGMIGRFGPLVLPVDSVSEFSALWNSHRGDIDTVRHHIADRWSNVFRLFGTGVGCLHLNS